DVHRRKEKSVLSEMFGDAVRPAPRYDTRCAALSRCSWSAAKHKATRAFANVTFPAGSSANVTVVLPFRRGADPQQQYSLLQHSTLNTKEISVMNNVESRMSPQVAHLPPLPRWRRILLAVCLGLALLSVSSVALAQYQLTNLVSNQVLEAHHD